MADHGPSGSLDAEPLETMGAAQSSQPLPGGEEPAFQQGASLSPKASSGQVSLQKYVRDLRHLLPFGRDEEVVAARRLEFYEMRTWCHILKIPSAVAHLHALLQETPSPVSAEVGRVLAFYSQKAATRQGVPRGLKKLAKGLRELDGDREIIDAVLLRLRHELALQGAGAAEGFHLSLADLKKVEGARAAALQVRNEFVQRNLRLVFSVARYFAARGAPYIDAIQDGNLGLVKAVHRFDHRMGFRFSTYAHWWIKHCIRRALSNTDAPLRLPAHVGRARRLIGEAKRTLTRQLGRAPSTEEIATALNATLRGGKLLVPNLSVHAVSMDEPIQKGETRTLVESIHDETAALPEETAIQSNTAQLLKTILTSLNPLEQDIIRRRFGIGAHAHTLDEVSQVHNLSRERIRQIQQSSMIKLRRLCKYHQISLT